MDTASRSLSLDNLATAVFARFKQTGRMEDPEEAITCHSSFSSRTYQSFNLALDNFAVAVYAHFHQWGGWRI